MTICPLSGASWPAKKQSSATEDPQSYGERKEMQQIDAPSRGTPRQWELRKVSSLLLVDADYWSDASLSLPHSAFKLPESTETHKIPYSPLPSLHIESPSIPSSTHYQIPPARLRRSSFPPPLESPALCEGPYHHLQSLDKACFISVRSHGRLLLTETPHAALPQRRLHTQRRNGRLLLQLYEESGYSEMGQRQGYSEMGQRRETMEERNPLVAEGGEEDPAAGRESEEDPRAEMGVEGDPIAEMGKEEDPIAEKAVKGDSDAGEEGMKRHPIIAGKGKAEVRKASQSIEGEDTRCTEEEEEEEEEEGKEEECRIDGAQRSSSLYTKVLKTLEGDAFTDCSAEVLNLTHGRSCGVASFFHKSLTRVRPLSMLHLWQS